MKKSMDAKRFGALVVLPFLIGAAPLAASAEETLTQPAAQSAMPGAVESPAVAAPATAEKPEAVLAPEPTATSKAADQTSTGSAAAKPADVDTVPPAVAAQDLIGKPVKAADGKSIGKVTAVKAGSSGELLAVHIETGGYFGFWTTLREVPAGEFTPTSDGIQLRLASNEIENLSKIETPKG